MIRHTGMVDHWLRAVPSVQPGSTGKADSPVGNAASSLTPVPRATSLSAASVHSTCNSQRTAAPVQRASFMAVSGERENVETNPPQTINDRDSAVLRDSAPFYSVAYEVRRTNKHDFNAKREELKRSWPEFGKHYEKYRQWRDCSESDPKLDKLRSEGVKAQLFIMQKANVLADPEKKRLFELLEKQPDLLKYVSPINGDFRAPRIGVLAGLRFTRDQSGVERPTLAFPGTGSGAMIRSQLRINRTQFLRKDRPPEAYELGVKLANTIRAELAKSGSTDAASKLALTGHSLGGGMASFVGASIAEPAANYVPNCYLFNPAALGGGTIKSLNDNFKDELRQRTANHRVIRVKHDQVSSPTMQRRLAAAASALMRTFIQVPRHLGQVYVIARDMLQPKNQGLSELHRLESLQDVYLDPAPRGT